MPRRALAAVLILGVWLSAAWAARAQSPALPPGLEDRLDAMAAAELARVGIAARR